MAFLQGNGALPVPPRLLCHHRPTSTLPCLLATLLRHPSACHSSRAPRYRGVSKKKGKWEAKVMVNRRWAYRELFDRLVQAVAAPMPCERLHWLGPMLGACTGRGCSRRGSGTRAPLVHPSATWCSTGERDARHATGAGYVFSLMSSYNVLLSLPGVVQRGGGGAGVRPRAVAPQAQGGPLLCQLQGRGEPAVRVGAQLHWLAWTVGGASKGPLQRGLAARVGHAWEPGVIWRTQACLPRNGLTKLARWLVCLPSPSGCHFLTHPLDQAPPDLPSRPSTS